MAAVCSLFSNRQRESTKPAPTELGFAQWVCSLGGLPVDRRFNAAYLRLERLHRSSRHLFGHAPLRRRQKTSLV